VGQGAPIAEADRTIPWRHGVLRGRVYTPQSGRGRPILLVPGVHAAGLDEPRLVEFAREIAGAGHPVITAQLDDLAQYMITTRTTDMIEDAALSVSATADAGAPGPIGIVGISFAAGCRSWPPAARRFRYGSRSRWRSGAMRTCRGR
jgi:dienelactone hydrolase